jgi:hypothetical protein
VYFQGFGAFGFSFGLFFFKGVSFFFEFSLFLFEVTLFIHFRYSISRRILGCVMFFFEVLGFLLCI